MTYVTLEFRNSHVFTPSPYTSSKQYASHLFDNIKTSSLLESDTTTRSHVKTNDNIIYSCAVVWYDFPIQLGKTSPFGENLAATLYSSK